LDIFPNSAPVLLNIRKVTSGSTQNGSLKYGGKPDRRHRPKLLFIHIDSPPIPKYAKEVNLTEEWNIGFQRIEMTTWPLYVPMMNIWTIKNFFLLPIVQRQTLNVMDMKSDNKRAKMPQDDKATGSNRKKTDSSRGPETSPPFIPKGEESNIPKEFHLKGNRANGTHKDK